jgi:hypothetical protein
LLNETNLLKSVSFSHKSFVLCVANSFFRIALRVRKNGLFFTQQVSNNDLPAKHKNYHRIFSEGLLL